MTKNAEKFKWGLIIFTYICMTVFGLYENMTGPAVPSIVMQFDTTYSAIGTMLVLCTLGYLAGTFFGGIATDKFGFKPVFIASFILVIISGILFRYANSFIVVVSLFVLMRIGFGGFETGCHSLGAKIFIRFSALMMNVMHLFFGAGSIMGSELLGGLVSGGRQWHSAFFSASLIGLAGLAISIFIAFPSAKEDEKHSDFNSLKSLPLVLKDRVIWTLMLALGFSELLELGMAGWIVNFLETSGGSIPRSATFYYTMFFVFFSVARLLGGWIAEKTGYFKFAAICGFSSSILFLIAYIFAGPMTICYSIAGAPIGMVFPTIMAIIIRHFKQNIGMIIGIIIALGGVVYMAMSQLVGIIADYVSIHSSFLLIGLAGFITCVFLIFTRKGIGKEVYH